MATDLNTIAEFLSQGTYDTFEACQPVDCVILCISQVIWQTEQLFTELERRPGLTKLLVIVGGIGHSTKGVCDAATAAYPSIGNVDGLAEARVVERLLQKFETARIRSQGCRILYEDQSTNCGSNAIETKKLLEASGEHPNSYLLIQDPTMLLRTRASFEKSFSDTTFATCAAFVPRLDHNMQFNNDIPGMWKLDRYIGLLLGEVPRLRDDSNGYGPKGKDFIVHVDVPEAVESAYSRAISKHKPMR